MFALDLPALMKEFYSTSSELAGFFRIGIRPAKLIIYPTIVLYTAIYMGVMYNDFCLDFTSLSVVFEETFGFKSARVGLKYLGLGIHSMVGL